MKVAKVKVSCQYHDVLSDDHSFSINFVHEIHEMLDNDTFVIGDRGRSHIT